MNIVFYHDFDDMENIEFICNQNLRSQFVTLEFSQHFPGITVLLRFSQENFDITRSNFKFEIKVYYGI